VEWKIEGMSTYLISLCPLYHNPLSFPLQKEEIRFYQCIDQ
jgi:hypothetical protein